MTLLITVFAAIASTVVWYAFPQRKQFKLGMLSLIYWGASLMWFVDAIFEYADLKAEYFTPAASDVMNDSLLGLTVVALGLIIWLASVLINDPKKVLRQ